VIVASPGAVPEDRPVGVNARKGVAGAGLAVAAVLLVVWARGQVPSWLRDWVLVAGALLVLSGGAWLVPRWWPEAQPDHPPRRADPAAPRPQARSARRTLLGIDAVWVLDAAVTGLTAGLLPGWLRRAARDSPQDGPVWFQLLTTLAGAAVLVGALLALGLQAVLLHRAVRRIPAGREPRWLATVVRNSPGALTLRAARVGRSGPPRLVRIANTVKDFAGLDPGDEIVLDGRLRRWGWVAVSGLGRTRWVNVTWRQPRPA
jgi:hypothetical protein